MKLVRVVLWRPLWAYTIQTRDVRIRHHKVGGRDSANERNVLGQSCRSWTSKIGSTFAAPAQEGRGWIFFATLKEFEMMNQMEDEPQQSFPKQKPQKEASMPVITSDRRTDVCYVKAFRSLGFRVPYLRDGPFWALADGTEMLRPFGFLAYM